MVVGIVIGSGVFFKATSVFNNNGGDMLKSILTVLVVGVLMTICAYTFSILAGKHSKINGIVDYAEGECGRGLAYTVGKLDGAEYTAAMSALETAPITTLSDLAVGGGDMIALGIKGKKIGLMLDRLALAVINGVCKNERTVLTNYAKENMNAE